MNDDIKEKEYQKIINAYSFNIKKVLKSINDVISKYKFNFIFDVFNLTFSVASCAVYIISTYYACSYHQSNSYLLFNLVTRIYFIIDFLLNIFISKRTKWKFSDIIYITIELITILPYFIIRIVSGFEENYIDFKYVFTLSLITIRIFRIEFLSKYISNEVTRKLYTIVSSIFSLLVIFSSIIQVVENFSTVGSYAFFYDQSCIPVLCQSPNSSIYSSFFFVMTTISTIGYFSNIHSIIGRVLIIFLIVVSLVVIPKKSSELMMLLASKSIYSRLSYKRIENIKYILITGNITYNSMYDLLQEYFHPDHGENERHALILLPQTPDINMKYLLQKYQNKLFYFEGEPLKEIDLKRCQFTGASTIIILCNKQTDDSSAEDSKTILQAMAIKKLFSLDEKRKENENVETKMLIQLLRPESELHYSLSISRDKNIDQILCIDELKLSLLAKSCLCQGIIALISNLIMTSNIDLNENFIKSHKWLEVYTKGKDYEIYKVSLESFRGEVFESIVSDIYNEKEVILFGLAIEDKIELNTLVLLNPTGFSLPLQNEINIFGYLLAKDKSTADDVIFWGHKRKSEMVSIKKVNETTINQNDKKTKASLFNSQLDLNKEEVHSNDEREINDLYTSSDVISISYLCHITTEAIDKSTVICDTIENKLVALEHIIICGICQNFIDFVKPLRAKHLPKSKCPTIVILTKDIPDDKIWSTIAFFEQIYIVQGDPMNKEDLQRAGIKNAIKVVILSPSLDEIFKSKGNIDENKRQARKLTKEEEDLLDSKTIFKYNMISKLKKDIFIVIELINPKNVSFLYNKGRRQNDEYLFIKDGIKIDCTSSFAAGEVYFSSIMDNLLVQAYYNKSLLDVLKKIILGEDQSIYKKPPLNMYRQIVSSNLYLIDNPFDSDEKIKDFLYIDKDNREIIQDKKLNFKEVFNYLLNKGILMIGIYRSIDSVGNSKTNINTHFLDKNSSNFYFVYTSPNKLDNLDNRDKLFVLSQSYPDHLLEATKPKQLLQNTMEGNPFKNHIASNLKKTEERKEPKFESVDKVGITKIKEINNLLKDVNSEIEVLKDSLITLHDNINLDIANEIRRKISSLYDIKYKPIKENRLYNISNESFSDVDVDIEVNDKENILNENEDEILNNLSNSNSEIRQNKNKQRNDDYSDSKININSISEVADNNDRNERNEGSISKKIRLSKKISIKSNLKRRSTIKKTTKKNSLIFKENDSNNNKHFTFDIKISNKNLNRKESNSNTNSNLERAKEVLDSIKDVRNERNVRNVKEKSIVTVKNLTPDNKSSLKLNKDHNELSINLSNINQVIYKDRDEDKEERRQNLNPILKFQSSDECSVDEKEGKGKERNDESLNEEVKRNYKLSKKDIYNDGDIENDDENQINTKNEEYAQPNNSNNSISIDK